MESVEETVARLKQRYGRGQAAKYDPDSDQVPQRLLMPGNGDPNLFQVRVKVGHKLSGATFELFENTTDRCSPERSKT